MLKIKEQETGRSMVEMLGVLAVIGVLSVAGIAGYSSAMNKYRANELLNEASKRATILAMQIASGKAGEGLSIGEFTQPSGYLFGVDKSYATGGKTLKLTLSKDPSGKIDEDVCAQMKATAGDNGIMQVNTDCTEITFNADLSAGSKDSNTDTDICTPACNAGEECIGGSCLALETCDPNTFVPFLTDNDDPGCYSCFYVDLSDERDTICQSSTACKKNADCVGKEVDGTPCGNNDCYCAIYADSDFDSEMEYRGMIHPTGLCIRFSENEKSNSQKESDGPMSWWSAVNFCKAKGSHIIKLSEACDCTDPNNCDASTCIQPARNKTGAYWLAECWCNNEENPNCTCTDNSEEALLVNTDENNIEGNFREMLTTCSALCKQQPYSLKYSNLSFG